MELSLPNPLIENTLYIYFMCQDVAIEVTKNNNFKSMPIQIIENLYENKSFFFCVFGMLWLHAYFLGKTEMFSQG